VTELEDEVAHAVVQRARATRVLTLDGGEDSLDVVVCADPDSSDVFIGGHQQDRHRRQGGVAHMVDVANEPAPIVMRHEASVSGDFHYAPLRSAPITNV